MIQVENDIVSVIGDDGSVSKHTIGSPEAFSILSKIWLRSGWDTKYVYSFTWLGRPIIQLPEDLMRLQEVIYQVKPDVILEIGIAHGGSLILSASLCKLMGKGRVVGVDIEIRPHNRTAVEAHTLYPLITMIEGDSVSAATIEAVKSEIKDTDTVLVCLDGCHTRAHVLAELEAYGPLVSPGSYIIAMDGIMKDLVGAPRSESDWASNNPCVAAREFVSKYPEFSLEEPAFLFNESEISERVTYWPNAFVKRL